MASVDPMESSEATIDLAQVSGPLRSLGPPTEGAQHSHIEHNVLCFFFSPNNAFESEDHKSWSVLA